MPKHREVPPLQRLCVKSVGSLVVYMAPYITTNIQGLRDPQQLIQKLQKNLDWLNHLLLSHVPFYLYDIVAVEVLKSVKILIEKTKKFYYPVILSDALIEINVVVSLTEVVLNAHMKSIDFPEWPKIMRYILYKNLNKLNGMEMLNLGSCSSSWRTSEYNKCLIDGIRVMKNLRSLCLCFDCNDFIVQSISDNCPFIQCLDMTSSRSVTDRCVPYLLKCKQLKELHLNRTSLTPQALAGLIVDLPHLQNIGRYDDFSNVIKHLHTKYINQGPYGMKKIQIRDISTEMLRLFVNLFPHIEYISIFLEAQLCDLTVLISLDKLMELKLLSCAFYGDYLIQLLNIKGANLTSLHLEHVEEMDLNALIDISQYCPKIKSLVFYNCDFLGQTNHAVVANKTRFVQPFQHLERIFWVVDSAIGNLEFILSHAINIRHIHLGTSTGITHATIVNVLNVNPMKHLEELRILYSQDMNMRTVELLLASCTNLKVLSELESWQGISPDELLIFKKFIKTNNFDLDIRPTLSYSE